MRNEFPDKAKIFLRRARKFLELSPHVRLRNYCSGATIVVVVVCALPDAAVKTAGF